jgi:hypothetical protein
MTIYIVENYYDEPFYRAHKTIESARLGLLEEYTKSCLPEMIEIIKEGKSVAETADNIKTDLENILAHGYVEDFAIIHECELEE